MPCDKCSANRLNPKGVSNPKIYIITDMPNDEDFDTGYPCSGASGNYLMQTLSYCNLIDKVRIISLCNCDVGHDEDINFDECVTCNLLTDLIQSNPQVIVGVGKKIIQYFLKDQFTSMKAVCGRVYNINICGFDYKFIPIYSATYVLSEISESELNDKYTTVPADYQKMINNIALFISGKLDNVEAGKKIEYCLTYKEVEDKLNSEEFSNANLLAYDIETNARPIFDEDGEIIGYSHAVKNHGFYVCLKSLDYEMPEDDRNKCFDKLLDTLKTKRVIVHNSMYERPYTLKVLNYEIPFESLEDTLVMSRLMLGGHVGAGLKNQAQTNLGYHDWETDLDKYLDACRGLLVGALNEKCNEVSKFEDIIGISTNKWCVEFKTHYENYREVCYKYYNIEETDNLLKLLFEKWVPFYKNKNRELPECLPYNIIPQRLLCKYGAMDSLATYDLYDYYREIMDRQSNEDVDLHFGYRTWLEQFYAGYVFEKNGMYWNDEFVTKERQEYNDTAVECLKNMILNPKLKDLIIDKVYDKYVGRVLSLYYPQFYECTDYKVEYDNVSGKTTVYQKKSESDKYKRVAASKLYEIPLSKSAQKILNNKIYEIACKELKEYKTFEECKAIFNPQSSKQYDVINKALYTDDIIWSDRISELNLFFKSLKYVPGYMDAIKYSSESDIDFMMKCSQGFECIEELKNNHNIRWGTKQKNINNILESLSNCRIDTPILKSICYNNYKVNKADTYKEDEVDESSGYEMTREKLMEIDKLYQTMLCQGDDITLIDLASQICNEKNLKKTYGEDWCNHRHEMFEGFKELAPIVSMHSPTVVKIMSHTFKMESYDDEAIIKIFNLMLIQGIDADNKDTWNDEFKWLMSFRIFKKVFKIIASYIDGKIGRQSVVVVDKADLISGQDRVLRKRHYYDDNCRIDKATEDYIVASNFKVCTAETGRWQSGFHTIPFGSPVKKYYSSRYKGGTIFMPDYSQNEVRALAAASKCKPMIDAFLAGADIHRRNAAAIFGRPENEILDVERRFAKMACRPGYTRVKLLDGRIMTMEDMYNSGVKDYWTYSWDISNQKLVPGRVVDVMRTKRVSQIAVIEFSNGLTDESTIDHPYLCADGYYRQAHELQKGQMIETLYTRIPTKGAYAYCRSHPNHYEQYRDLRHISHVGPGKGHLEYGKWMLTHKAISQYENEESQSGHIDHIDNNSLNNSPDNLRVISPIDNWHKSTNRSLDGFGHLRKAFEVVKYLKTQGIDFTETEYNSHRYLFGKRLIKYNKLLSYQSKEWIWDNCDYYDRMTNKQLDHNLFIDYTPSKLNPQFLTVRSVKIVNKTEWVYDLSVERYHNYAAYLGNNTSVFCHNTFSILYGATYDSFAENYLDGDVEKAKDIYEKFYAAFPDIRDWQQKMYKTYDETGRVPVFTGRYIVIAPDGVYNGSHASAYRKAGNYPIQGGSSDVVGSVLFEACNYIAHEHMKSKPFLFVHDSIEIDTHPDELIKMAVKMKDLLIRIPIEKFGMPVKADVALGCSLGHELEMKSIEANDDMTECTMVLEGYRNEIEDTINNWKQVYSTVDMIDCWRIATDERGEPLKDENGDKVKVHGEWDKEYISYKELYVVKRSYNKYCGSHLEKGFAKIYIKY